MKNKLIKLKNIINLLKSLHINIISKIFSKVLDKENFEWSFYNLIISFHSFWFTTGIPE